MLAGTLGRIVSPPGKAQRVFDNRGTLRLANPQTASSKNPADNLEANARTLAHGERALGAIKQLQLSAIPQNYELLYAFIAATDKELCNALRCALETHSSLTNEMAASIYKKYLDNQQVPERVEKVSSKVSQEMSDIMEVIEAASERTGHYGESLKGVNAKLSGIESPQQLQKVLGELFETTNDMAEYNEVLERRLANSKKKIDDLQMNLERTRLESFIDDLTGLNNRRRFDQTLELEMLEAAESGDPLCLLMIDIDRFKAFNDNFGHQTGDKVLRLVAQTMKTNIKGRDCAARYGGEEFTILLPHTKLAAAIILANQIREAVKTKELVKKSTGESLGHVTLSIGVSAYRKDETIPQFIERADVCLYTAKNAGRDNVKAETDLPRFRARTNAA